MTAVASTAPRDARGRSLAWLRGMPGVLLGCLLIAALSLLLPSAPTYDPWAWIIWGREVADFGLSTTGGPSWKPLPVFFTAPFSLFGDEAAPKLWVMVGRFGGLLAVAMAFRLAFRFAGGRERWGLLAGLVAGAGLLGSTGYVRAIWPGNSEGLLIAFGLWAIERHLDGRRDQALLLGTLVALLRPESWPFLAAYGLFLLIREPRLRLLTVGCGVATAALWFLPEYWGSGSLLRAAERANTPDPQAATFAEFPALRVLELWADTLPAILLALAVGGAIFALIRWRREQALAVLTLAALAWLALVMVMTEGGFSGNPRYSMPVTAIAMILAGVFVAWVAEAVEARVKRLAPMRVRAGVAVAAVVVGVALAFNPTSLERQWEGFKNDKAITDEIEGLVTRAGGRLGGLECGMIFTGRYAVPAVAWYFGVPTIQVGFIPKAPGSILTAAGVKMMPPITPEFRPAVRSGRWTLAKSCIPEPTI